MIDRLLVYAHKKNFLSKSILIIYFFVLSCFVFYSYSQIDLNLTLSSNSAYQQIQSSLIYLGYFSRPLSTFFFTSLLIMLFLLYAVLIYLCKKTILSHRAVLIIILASYGILFFAYPAFSHDIFNYLFDARIVTKYHVSPYNFTALDFPNDLWTRFMHWTHRYFPYGPFWLLLTIPLSIIGQEKFVPTLILFKLMFVLFALGNVWLVGKLSLEKNKSVSMSMLLFGLNPLILIESAVSPHNDVLILFFSLAGLFLLFRKQRIASFITFLLGVGVKFTPIIYLPLALFSERFLRDKEKLYVTLFLLNILVLLPVILLREPYPWYFIPLIALSILSRKKLLIFLMAGLSMGLLLRYVPFLYYGDYGASTSIFQSILTVISLFAGIVAYFIYRRKSSHAK